MQENLNYRRVAQAIDYLQTHFREQPQLEKVAAAVNLSPAHFQRIFSEWAGTSPKRFLQYISVEHAKSLLSDQHHATLFDTAHEIGLSSTSRLHDLFVNIEGMTPGEYKNEGANLTIQYSYADSPFGRLIVASTPKGICHMAFIEEETAGLNTLKDRFPQANYIQMWDTIQEEGLALFQNDWTELKQIKLHLKGTPFQLKVWEALLKIPLGRLSTYGALAQGIEKPKASRAVGTAIGSNPVAFLIPCHRVIQSSGKFGGYMWGPTRKTAIIGWEAAQIEAR